MNNKPHRTNCGCCSCRSKRGEPCSVSPEKELLRRQKISRATKGRASPLKRVPQPKLQGDKNPNKRPEVRKKHKEIQTSLWKDKNYRSKLIASHVRYENQPCVKAKKSSEHKKRWQDSQFIQKQMFARSVAQNKTEKLLEVIIRSVTSEFQFVGDGHLILFGKCPDFVDNNRKLIIELFGDYWHSQEITGVPEEQHIQERIEHFSKQGYKTLVLWEHELREPEKVLRKIEEFCNAGRVAEIDPRPSYGGIQLQEF